MSLRALTTANLRWAQPWADRIARFGLVAKGVVLLMVAGLALLAATGGGERATDPYGAMLKVGQSPAARVVLVVIAVGLLAHALFRIALSLVGEPYVEGAPTSGANIARRIAYAGSALIYMALAWAAVALGFGGAQSGRGGGDAEARHEATQIMHLPFGRFVLGAVALGILVAAVIYTARAFRKDEIRQRLRVEDMTPTQYRVMALLGRVAYLARAIVLGIVGYFLAGAALHAAPRAARGTGGALRALGAQPYGDVWLGIVAAGLIAFAVFVLLEARWRRLLGR